MSWAEVYKINSDMSTQLDHLFWLDYARTYGTSEIGDAKLQILYTDYALSMNTEFLRQDAFDWIYENQPETMNRVFSAFSEFDGTDISEDTTMYLLGADETAWEIIVNNDTLYGMVSANEGALEEFNNARYEAELTTICNQLGLSASSYESLDDFAEDDDAMTMLLADTELSNDICENGFVSTDRYYNALSAFCTNNTAFITYGLNTYSSNSLWHTTNACSFLYSKGRVLCVITFDSTLRSAYSDDIYATEIPTSVLLQENNNGTSYFSYATSGSLKGTSSVGYFTYVNVTTGSAVTSGYNDISDVPEGDIMVYVTSVTSYSSSTSGALVLYSPVTDSLLYSVTPSSSTTTTDINKMVVGGSARKSTASGISTSQNFYTYIAYIPDSSAL